MTTTRSARSLSTGRAAALYIGALLGPSVLLLPGLAASLAGPASILAWIGLLLVSALLARVFTALGTRLPGAGGVGAYARAGLGERAGRAVTRCFLAGVVLGAPVVCLIGGAYVSQLLGDGRGQTVAVAGVLLALVVAITLAGARASMGLQLVLVGVLVVLIVVAVLGSAPHAQAAHWTPFAPHGWSSLGRAASVLMLSFVGWEAIAPLTGRLADPARQLPRVIGIAFTVTSTVFLALAAATVGVLGPRAGSAVPVADLLRVAIGPAGRVVAAVAAVLLTLAATNAYLSGAAELLASVDGRRRQPWRLQGAIAFAGAIVLIAVGCGWVSTAQLVAVPTALFLSVYLGCTAAATRVLDGSARLAAILALIAVVGVLAFSGWALLVPAAVALAGRRGRRPVTIARLGCAATPPSGGPRAARVHHRGHRAGRLVPQRAARG